MLASEPAASCGRRGREYLDLTSIRPFLQALGDPALLERWAETAFGMIRLSGYTLLDMFESRVREHPRKILFQDMSSAAPVQWTYEQVGRRLREIAGAFYAMGEEDGAPPRVADLRRKQRRMRLADLACLFYDILDTPINPHFNIDNLVEIFDALAITIAVTDREDRRKILAEVRRRTARPFRILTVAPAPGSPRESRRRRPHRIRQAATRSDASRRSLDARRRRPVNEVCHGHVHLGLDRPAERAFRSPPTT